MNFVRTDLPVWLGFLGGMTMLIAMSVAFKPAQELSRWFLEWTVVFASFAMALGYGNMLRVNLNRVRFKRGAWKFSYVTLFCMICYFLLGLAVGPRGAGLRYVFTYVYTPISASVFSLNAFFICTACYRAFRVRNAQAAVLLLSGIIVMLGRVGIGTAIWPGFAVWTSWIMNIPTSAGMRAVNIGAALGAIGVGFRMILGLERGHLGGGE
jgi:hypothetical protein